MELMKLFIAAFMFIMIINEVLRMEVFGNDRESVVKMGIMFIMEIWLLGG